MRSASLPAAFSRRGPARRAIALAVAGLCLGGQLASFAHLLAVRHVTCPEHGEIIHRDAVASRSSSWRDRAAEHSSLHASRSAAARDGHDACLVWAHRHERADIQRAGASVRVEASTNAVERNVRAVPALPAPLLLLAPKSSPPA